MHKAMLMDVLQGCQETVDKATQLCCINDGDKGTNSSRFGKALCFVLAWDVSAAPA